MPRNRVTWPFKGRVDANARGDQPELTTSEARNVRNYASGTERLQGGQRPGLVKWSSARPNGFSSIQSLTTLVYDQPPFTYSADPDDISAAWEFEADTGAQVLDVQVDNDGNSYWLLSDGSIQKRNSQGASQWLESFPRSDLAIVPRLAIDPFGGFYVALQPAPNIGGPTARIIKLTRTAQDEYASINWTIDLPRNNVTDLKWQANLLWVGQNDNLLQRGEIRVYDGLQADQPAFVSDYLTAWPLRQFDISRGGIVYQAAPSLERALSAVVDDGGNDPDVDWSPINLLNYEQRLHFWTDAQRFSGGVSGQEVSLLDHRQDWVDYYNTISSGFPDVADNTVRSLSRTKGGNVLPQYDPVAINNLPGYRFDRDRATTNDDSFFGPECSVSPQRGGTGPWVRTKPDVVSKLPRSLGMWPQTEQHTFASTWLVRLADDEPQVIFSASILDDRDQAADGAVGSNASKGQRNCIKIIANADYPLDALGNPVTVDTINVSNATTFGTTLFGGNFNPEMVSDPGRFMLVSPTYAWNLEAGYGTDIDTYDGGALAVAQVGGNTEAVAADPGPNDDRVYLVTLVVEYKGPGSGYGMRLRVNGTESPEVTYIPESHENLKEPQEVMGGRAFKDEVAGNPLARSYAGGRDMNCPGMNGWLMEQITYFADTTSPTATPHDKTYGTRASGSGSSSNFFLDVEKVEAYMAWHYGVNAAVLVTPAVPGVGTDGNQYTGSPPGGGTGGVSASIAGAVIQEQLRSSLGICAKTSLTTNTHVWAYAGAGFGYCQTVNPENGVVWTLGPKDLGYPVDAAGDPVAGDANWDFGAIARKLVDSGTTAVVRRAGYAEVHFYGVPVAGDTIQFTNDSGGIVNTLTFVSGTPGAQEIQITGSTTLDDLFDDKTAGGFRDKLSDAASGTSPWVALPDGGAVAVYVPKSVVPFRTLRLYYKTTAANPDFQVNVTGSYALVRFQMINGLSGDTADDDLDAWSFGGDYQAGQPDPDDIQARMDHDFGNNVVMPARGRTSVGTKQNHIWRLVPAPQSSSPTDVLNTVAPYPNLVGQVDVNYKYNVNGSVGTDFAVTAVAFRPDETQFYPDEKITGSPYVWVGNDNIDSSGDITAGLLSQHKLELVQRTPVKQNARRVQYFATVQANAYRLSGDKLSWTDLGVIANSSSAVYHEVVPAFGQLFFVVDGKYSYYDPLRSGDSVEPWTASTAGEMPEGCRLAAFYRGRLVLARSDVDPFRIYASAVGDPFDWDLSPAITTPTAAFGGSNQDQTRNPDIINALAPFYDDVLLVGGDHSITQFRGDLSELGQIDYFTDVTGMAFGHSWALSPEGLLYFFGSRGGVWVMQPTTDGRAQPPVEITRDTIAQALRSINLTNYLVRLMWDHDAQGLHVYLTPNQGTVSTSNIHYFYEARTKSWWEVTLATTGLQPVCCGLLDGDTPDERQAAIGCYDGYIRRFADSAANDDGEAIDSSVLIGPLVAPEAELEQRISALQATLASTGGCDYEVYANDHPVLPVSPQSTGTLVADRNQRVSVRVRGGYVWIRLTNAASAARWALESLFIDLHYAGRRRNRP